MQAVRFRYSEHFRRKQNRLQCFVSLCFAQFPTQNRFTLLLELL